MKEFFHYGKRIVVQYGDYGQFRETLRENNVSWVDLPIIDDDVIYYEKNGNHRYAYIVPIPESDEKVFTMEEVPMDMNWKNINKDYYNQENGYKPMEMITKAKQILDKAVRNRETYDKDDIFSMPEVNVSDVKLELIQMGYPIDMLLEMDHHDCDEEFMLEIKNAKL